MSEGLTWSPYCGEAPSPDALRAGMDGLGEDLVKARAAYQHAQEYDEALFGEDFDAQ